MARFVMLLLLASALQSCRSACMQVQEAMCACAGRTQNERQGCEDRASVQDDLAAPDDAAQARCEQLLPGCEALLATDCTRLDPEGRVACGLSER